MSKSFKDGKPGWGDKGKKGFRDDFPRPRKGGFEDEDDYSDWKRKCFHPQHEPPMHLHVPAGKVYRHVCPGCGAEAVIHSSEPTLSDSTALHDEAQEIVAGDME